VSNKRISELTAATTPAETDVMPIVQAATTKKATVSAWVRGALLTGLSTATNTAIAATDSVLVALGKAQAQITGHIGNTTNAHGMTTPGAAIVQAASVADQRAALGLENHQYIDVDSNKSVNMYGTADHDLSLTLHSTTGAGKGLRFFTNARAAGVYNSQVQAGDQFIVTNYSGGGELVVGQHDGASWRLTSNSVVTLHAVYAGGGIRPITDNGATVGAADLRFSTAYFATSPVVGSDTRLKCDYSVIPGDIAHELLLKIVPRVGKFIVGGQEAYEVEETTTNEVGEEVTQKVTRYREVPGSRYHTYYLAQEVKAALDSVVDRWPQASNLALWLLSDVEDVDSVQMIRYEQMIPIIHAATVWQWQQK